MKKILAISSVFLLSACALTSCGADRNDGRSESYYEHYDYGRADGDTVKEHARDAVDGAKNAGEDIVDGAGSAANDIIGGAGDAANDIIDGLDGDMSGTRRTTEHTSMTTTTTRR